MNKKARHKRRKTLEIENQLSITNKKEKIYKIQDKHKNKVIEYIHILFRIPTY